MRYADLFPSLALTANRALARIALLIALTLMGCGGGTTTVPSTPALNATIRLSEAATAPMKQPSLPAAWSAVGPGAVVVANTGGNSILAYDPRTQSVTTVVGGLTQPTGVAFAPDGSLCASLLGGRVVRIDVASGAVETVAQGGRLASLFDLVFDGADRLDVTNDIDPSNAEVTRITPSTAAQAKLTELGGLMPDGIAFSSVQGLLYVVSDRDRRLIAIDAATGETRPVGFFASDPGDVDVAQNGDVWFSDLFRGVLIRVPIETGVEVEVSRDAAGLRGLAADGDGTVVAQNGTSLLRFGADGSKTTLWSGSPLNAPQHLTVSPLLLLAVNDITAQVNADRVRVAGAFATRDAIDVASSAFTVQVTGGPSWVVQAGALRALGGGHYRCNGVAGDPSATVEITELGGNRYGLEVDARSAGASGLVGEVTVSLTVGTLPTASARGAVHVLGGERVALRVALQRAPLKSAPTQVSGSGRLLTSAEVGVHRPVR